MPHFTKPFTHRQPVVDVVISASSERIHALRQAGERVPPAQHIRGLIDTGASSTCLSLGALNALSLVRSGTVKMHTPSTGTGTVVVDSYDVSIILPGAQGVEDGLILPNLRINACELDESQGFQALIGRDILSHCFLTYNGALGWITLAY